MCEIAVIFTGFLMSRPSLGEKRWLANTLIKETDWKASKLRALHENKDGHTDKLGGEFNPVEYPEG